MINSLQTSGIGRSLLFFWDKVLAVTKNWMPDGFVPKTAVWISAEWTCATTAEALVPVVLQTADAIAEATIPFYRKIPLISFIALPILAMIKYSGNSKKNLSKIFLISPVLLYFYSIQDLEAFASQSTKFLVYNLAAMAASISGGYLGLKLTHSSQNWADYRFQMVEHAFAGRVFDLSITPADKIIFKIPRGSAKILFQTVIYNRRNLSDLIVTKIKNPKSYGVITPILTKFLYNRFESINRQNLALEISRKILPFFSSGATGLFSGAIIQPLLTRKIDKLQSHSADLVNILAKSLIEYANLLAHPQINKATTSLVNLISKDASKDLIKTAIKELQALLETRVAHCVPEKSAKIQLLNEGIIWNKENLNSLAKILSNEVESMGIFLLGSPIYSKQHLKCLDILIKIHLKPFTYFTFSRGLHLQFAGLPLSSMEDIQLNAILHHALFFALIEPLLPECLKGGCYKAFGFGIQSATQAIHKLQGFKPSTTVYEAPLAINSNHFYAPPPSPLSAAKTKTSEAADASTLGGDSPNDAEWSDLGVPSRIGEDFASEAKTSEAGDLSRTERDSPNVAEWSDLGDRSTLGGESPNDADWSDLGNPSTLGGQSAKDAEWSDLGDQSGSESDFVDISPPGRK